MPQKDLRARVDEVSAAREQGVLRVVHDEGELTREIVAECLEREQKLLEKV